MRFVIGLIVIVYLVGVGVVLAPTVTGDWNKRTGSELSASLEHALAWPAGLYRSMTPQAETAQHVPQSSTP